MITQFNDVCHQFELEIQSSLLKVQEQLRQMQKVEQTGNFVPKVAKDSFLCEVVSTGKQTSQDAINKNMLRFVQEQLDELKAQGENVAQIKNDSYD